jgi:Zn finger protein HypA/HybF involved in hydrogenase expression
MLVLIQEVATMEMKCPGAKAFTQPKPEFIPCPSCHSEVEIWTDEAEAKCDRCGNMVSREMLQGCVDYCASAKECLGEQLYNRLMAAKQRAKGG